MSRVPLSVETPSVRLSEVHYGPDRRFPPHAHGNPSVTLVFAGALEEGVGGDERQAGAASVVVKPAGTRHRNRFGPAGSRTLLLELRSSLVAELGEEETPRRWEWIDGGPPAAAMLRLLRAAREEPEALADAVDDLALDVLDRLADREPRADPPGAAPRWLRRLRDRLHDEPAAPLRVRDLAAAAGVHPVHLARRFRRHFGLPVTEYRRRLRVRTAAGLLAAGDLPLARVALAAGFADQSHLSRTLRAELGMTPGMLRRLTAR